MDKINKINNINNICASKISNWYRRQKLISVLKKLRKFHYYDQLNLLDYFDFEKGLWDHRGLLSDIKIIDERESDLYIDCLSDYCSENEFQDKYSSDDDFSKDTFFECINKDETKNKQTLFQYIMSFFY